MRAVAADANVNMMAHYDFVNPPALKSLLSKGVHLESFSNEMLKAAQTQAFDIFEGLRDTNASWKKVYASWKKFRGDQYAWFAANELVYDQFAFPQVPLSSLWTFFARWRSRVA